MEFGVLEEVGNEGVEYELGWGVVDELWVGRGEVEGGG